MSILLKHHSSKIFNRILIAAMIISGSQGANVNPLLYVESIVLKMNNNVG